MSGVNNDTALTGTFGYLPTRSWAWFWAIVHMCVIVVLIVLPYALPIGWYTYAILIAYLLVGLHWYVLGECVIAVFEKRAEQPGYRMRSLPNFSYVISIPAHVLGVKYSIMRDFLNCVTHAAILMVLGIILLRDVGGDGRGTLWLLRLFVFQVVAVLLMKHLQTLSNA